MLDTRWISEWADIQKIEYRVSHGNDNPVSEDKMPATRNGKPVTRDQKQETSDQQPATSDHQPETSDQRPATSHLPLHIVEILTAPSTYCKTPGAVKKQDFLLFSMVKNT